MNGDRPLVSSVHGMVAAAHPLAAFAGAGVLRDGGNAFDAAVACCAALNVVEPFMSGLAGLGMATLYSARDKRVRCLDFVPGVPRGFDPSGCTKEDIYIGAKASGVPGNLAGWAALVDTYGTRSLGELLLPAIRLARDGFPVVGGIPSVTPEYWPLRSRDPEWVRVYTPGHADVDSGWILRQPDLAATLEQLAVHGPSLLYGGALGKAMVTHLKRMGGALSLADLEQVEAYWTDPVCVRYHDLDVHTLAPPAESFQYLLTLAILADTGIESCEPNGVEHLDRVIRAVRLAGEARIQHNHASPDVIHSLLAGERLATLRQRFAAGEGMHGRVQQWRPVTDPALVGRREHTTSLSVCDAAGNMVCITQSLGSIYGSGVVIPGTGVCMNNFLNWTDLDPESPNVVRPGDRLGMCLAPSIGTRSGQPALALGTPGSYGILQSQVQVLIQYLDFARPLNGAIDAPRVRLWDGDLLHYESRIDPRVVAELIARGHRCEAVDAYTRVVGGVQSVARDSSTGALYGAADARRDGYVAVP